MPFIGRLLDPKGHASFAFINTYNLQLYALCNIKTFLRKQFKCSSSLHGHIIVHNSGFHYHIAVPCIGKNRPYLINV
jgi:hypothetical protein